MANAIPKWVQERFSKLWRIHNGEEITYSQIEEALSPDKKSTIGVFLSELKKANWIEINRDGKDARVKTYKILEPNKILMEIARR